MMQQIRRLFIAVIAAIIRSAIATDFDTYVDSGTAARDLEVLNLRIQPYIELLKHIESDENNVVYLNKLCNFAATSEDVQMKCRKVFEKPVDSFFEILKAVTRNASSSTDDELTELSKAFTQSLKDIPLSAAHDLFYNENASMSWEMVNALKEVISASPVKSGRQLRHRISEESRRLYCSGIIDAAEERTGNYRGYFYAECNRRRNENLTDMFAMNSAQLVQYLEFYRNEENTLDAVNNFALIMHALKQDIAFEESEAIFAGALSDEFRNLIGTLRRLLHMCSPDALNGTAEEPQKFIKESKELVDLFEVFVSGKADTQIPLHICTMIQEMSERTVPQMLSGDCSSVFRDEEMFESIALSQYGTVPEDELNKVREKSVAAYALLSFYNYIAIRKWRVYRFSEQAMEFYKTVYTVPNVLMPLIPRPGNPKMAEKRKQKYISMIRAINNAPVAARKEVAERFPVDLLNFIACIE